MRTSPISVGHLYPYPVGAGSRRKPVALRRHPVTGLMHRYHERGCLVIDRAGQGSGDRLGILIIAVGQSDIPVRTQSPAFQNLIMITANLRRTQHGPVRASTEIAMSHGNILLAYQVANFL